jgi:hypothetical protein
MEKCKKGMNCCLCENCKQERRFKLKMRLILSVCILAVSIGCMSAVILTATFNIPACLFSLMLLYIGAWYFITDLIYLVKNNDRIGGVEI